MGENTPWRAEQLVRMRDGLTVSRDSRLGSRNAVTWFALGAGTDISQESYDRWAVYLGGVGRAEFLVGKPQKRHLLEEGQALLVPGGALCGVETVQGAVYTEILLEKEPIIMNEQIIPGKVLELKSLVEYQEGSVVNYSVVNNQSLRFVLMAFDEGTGLQPHRAPGNAIVTAIEGNGVIGYEGEEFELKEGESFRFAKGGLHSVTARDGRFKMSLLLVLE